MKTRERRVDVREERIQYKELELIPNASAGIMTPEEKRAAATGVLVGMKVLEAGNKLGGRKT